MFALANKAKIVSRKAVESFEVALTEQGFVRSRGGRRTAGAIDSPRGESIVVTGSPTIFHEARSWRACLFYLVFILREHEDFEAQIYSSSEGNAIPYRIHIPENMNVNKTYPLIIFFMVQDKEERIITNN